MYIIPRWYICGLIICGWATTCLFFLLSGNIDIVLLIMFVGFVGFVIFDLYNNYRGR
jgi:hypothetical protein